MYMATTSHLASWTTTVLTNHLICWELAEPFSPTQLLVSQSGFCVIRAKQTLRMCTHGICVLREKDLTLSSTSSLDWATWK